MKREIVHKKSYLKYLNEEIKRVYEKVVIARKIEPASKVDTIEILEELGLVAPSNTGIHRSLRKSIELEYRKKIREGFIEFRGIRSARILI
jgi:hypothetical protein